MRRCSALLTALLLGIPSAAHAFDCKKASTPREKLVCGTPSLLALDKQLNALYPLAKKAKGAPADLGERQKRWITETLDPAAPDVQKVGAAYRFRISQLRALAGQLPFKDQAAKSEGTEPYAWVSITVGDMAILRYPRVAKSAATPQVDAVNAEVAKLARGAATESISCETGSSFENFKFKVTQSKAGFYGVQLDDASGGCYCGCAHPASTTRFEQLWDLQSGKAVRPPLEQLFHPRAGKEAELAKRMLSENDAHNPELKKLDPACRKVYADDVGSVPKVAFAPKDRSFAFTPEFAHAVEACALTLSIPAQAVQDLVEADPGALQQLPRFVEAGFLSAQDAEAARAVAASLK